METPVVNRADVAKNMYRGLVLSQMRILKQEMELGGLTTSARTIELTNGVVIVCKKSFKQETIDVFIPRDVEYTENVARILHGFIVHPKIGDVKKYNISDKNGDTLTLFGVGNEGISKKKGVWYTLEDLGNCYSLVDNEKASFNVKLAGDTEWLGKEDSFGNNYWTDGKYVVSWKGNPSVQFLLSAKINIPGLSKFVNGGYSPFSECVYAKGRVITTFANGCLVAGAFIKKYEGTVYLVVLTVQLIDGVYTFKVVKTANVTNGWETIYTENVGIKLRVSAVISENCSNFVYDGVLYFIGSDLRTVSKTSYKIPETLAGERVITGTGGYNSDYVFAGKRFCWPSLSGNSLVYTDVVENASFKVLGFSRVSPESKVVPVYRGSPATQVTISVIGNGTGGPCAVGGSGVNVILEAAVNGSYCQAVWSGVDCYKGLAAVKRVSDCNGVYSVSVTIQPQNITAIYNSSVLDDIVVSGPNPIVANSQYTASNTHGDITWSISAGTIDKSSGYVASISGMCGTVTITATDKCGRSGSLDVAAPDGAWILVEDFASSCNCFPGGYDCVAYAVLVNGAIVTYTEGLFPPDHSAYPHATTIELAYCVGGRWMDSCCDAPPAPYHPCGDMEGRVFVKTGYTIYRWGCP